MKTVVQKTALETALSEQQIQKYGAVYTPEMLADYLAEKTLQYIKADSEFKKISSMAVGDPACGDGMLLQSMASLLSANQTNQFNQVSLWGMDLDKKALMSCKQNLTKFDNDFEIHMANVNSLCALENNPSKEKIFKTAFEPGSFYHKFDVVIANPPWGADITDYKEELDSKQYTTLSGQVNSFELFLEMATKIVRKGGYFAFIIPDSLLNHEKSNTIRSILSKSIQIKFIARLGEKIFPKINRACAVIICKNTLPSKNFHTDCFRLSSANRIKILSGNLSFSDAEKEHIHTVPQKRFLENHDRQFDIDLRENETHLIKKLRGTSKTLVDALSSTRGVELGNSGMISMCPKCQTWFPLSKTLISKCKNCGKKYDSSKIQTSITSQKRVANSRPIIAGSDLKRYVAKPSKWIVLGKKGINYKSEDTFESPKILIRKTGVGITAALDYTYSYTNQVVYILKNKYITNPGLEFFIALINSRAYYFFLIKAFGEIEWKSHPYLTQSQILSLPLPELESAKNKKIANEIILLLQSGLKQGKPSKQVDMKVEFLVGKLFGLQKNDYITIFNAINELDELLPVRELKNFDQQLFLNNFFDR